ncbi:MAG: arginine--tRNA ligase [Deltaproteobacteria bacterium]|nr:MAG: arginine--tRNA ligase [Deltaproteobacteria bacterium]
MKLVSELLTEGIRAAAVQAGLVEPDAVAEPFVPTADPRHGDYQCNWAFRLAKIARKAPREVAAILVERLGDNPMIARVELAGPGFVNVFLSDPWLGENLRARSVAADLGVPQVGAGRTMVIDYSSPNIAKRMHVGHLRSTIIGDAITRMYRVLGWKVIADNHIGDWGTQFGKLIVAWERWRDDAAYAEDPVAELQRLYQAFGEAAQEQPDLIERARAETVKLQEGESKSRALWQEFCRVSLEEFDRVYERLGVSFDVVLGESYYRDRLQRLVDDLLERGIAVHDQGAVIVPFDASDGKGLSKNPLLIRKSDGAALYGTTDLATVLHRVETWAPERVLYETDVRQALHFRQVFAASRKLGVEVEFVHIGHGMLKLDGGVASTRAGTVLNLVDVLDTAVAHARTVVDQASAHLSESERAEIAEAVGVGAVKITDLSQNPSTDIHFDWERMLAIEGDTAPYLLYANARCHSIFRKAGLDIETFVPGLPDLTHDTARAVALLVVRTPEVVIAATEAAKPNVLATHVFALARAFASFYSACRVLDEDLSAEVRLGRLSLVYAVARSLSLCLDLLGLVPLRRM